MVPCQAVVRRRNKVKHQNQSNWSTTATAAPQSANSHKSKQVHKPQSATPSQTQSHTTAPSQNQTKTQHASSSSLHGCVALDSQPVTCTQQPTAAFHSPVTHAVQDSLPKLAIQAQHLPANLQITQRVDQWSTVTGSISLLKPPRELTNGPQSRAVPWAAADNMSAAGASRTDE